MSSLETFCILTTVLQTYRAMRSIVLGLETLTTIEETFILTGVQIYCPNKLKAQQKHFAETLLPASPTTNVQTDPSYRKQTRNPFLMWPNQIQTSHKSQPEEHTHLSISVSENKGLKSKLRAKHRRLISHMVR